MLLLATLMSAFAQAPALPPMLPMPGLSVSPKSADARWVVADTPSQRFPEGDVKGPTFTAGTEVELIVADGDRVRVRASDKYGWVPASALTDVPPMPSLPTSPGLLGMPPLQPPK